MNHIFQFADARHQVRAGPGALAIDGGAAQPASLTPLGQDRYRVALGEREAVVTAVVHGETVHLQAFGRGFRLTLVDPVELIRAQSGASSNVLKAPMPGVVVELQVAPGDAVVAGQPLLTIESMKLLTVIHAPRDGEVAALPVPAGTTFEKDAALCVLVADGEEG